MKIALIAHDKKKSEIIELAKEYKDVLANYELYATGTTGTLVMGETALPIHRMKSVTAAGGGKRERDKGENKEARVGATANTPEATIFSSGR